MPLPPARAAASRPGRRGRRAALLNGTVDLCRSLALDCLSIGWCMPRHSDYQEVRGSPRCAFKPSSTLMVIQSTLEGAGVEFVGMPEDSPGVRPGKPKYNTTHLGGVKRTEPARASWGTLLPGSPWRPPTLRTSPRVETLAPGTAQINIGGPCRRTPLSGTPNNQTRQDLVIRHDRIWHRKPASLPSITRRNTRP